MIVVDVGDQDTLVVALGGNALLQRGEPMSLETQLRNVAAAAASLAALAKRANRYRLYQVAREDLAP